MKHSIRLLALFLSLALCLSLAPLAAGASELPPETVRFTRDEITLDKGTSCYLTEYVAYTGKGALLFRTESPEIVTVGESNGFLKGEKPGYALVTVRTTTGLSACTIVKVNGVSRDEVYDVFLDRSAMSIPAASSETIGYSTHAPSKLIGWQSSDPRVATVQNGTITAVAPGYALISVAVPGGRASCQVEVRRRKGKERSPAVFLSAYDLYGKPGAVKQISATSGQTGGTLLWTSSDPKVADVTGNNSGAYVRLRKEGTAVITASYGEGTDGASCVVSVGTADLMPQNRLEFPAGAPGSGVEISSGSIAMREGAYDQLSVSGIPAGGQVRWFLTDGKVDCVSLHASEAAVERCTLVAQASGSAEITAVVLDQTGTVIAAPTCRVTVDAHRSAPPVIYYVGHTDPLFFRAQDFVDACAMRGDNATLRSVRFTSLPDKLNCGVFYGSYTNPMVHKDVDSSTAYTASGTRNSLDQIVFIPMQTFDGVVRIPYVGTDAEGFAFDSEVEIHVGSRAAGFADVRESDWFAPAIEWAVARDVAQGVNENHFQPNSACTQAAILTFLYRAKGSPAISAVASPYQMPLQEWYRSAAIWAWEKGMVSDPAFNWFAPCTRADAVRFIWIAEGRPESGQADFVDVPAGSDYADAVAWAVERGVTEGVTAGCFQPMENCTRATILTFLYRALR